LADLRGGENYHINFGRILNSEKMELSPSSIKSDGRFFEIFREPPSDELLRNLRDDPARNAARFQAVDLLFKNKINAAQLSAVASHARKTLSAQTQ
jgi:hypothetical protein